MPDVFPMFRQGLWFGGKKTIDLKCYFHHITLWTWLIPVDVDLDYLAKVASVRFLYWEAAPPHPIPCSHCPPWRKVSVSFIFPLHFIDCSLHAWLCRGPGIWTHIRCKTRPLLCGQCSEDKGGPLTAGFLLMFLCFEWIFQMPSISFNHKILNVFFKIKNNNNKTTRLAFFLLTLILWLLDVIIF